MLFFCIVPHRPNFRVSSHIIVTLFQKPRHADLHIGALPFRPLFRIAFVHIFRWRERSLCIAEVCLGKPFCISASYFFAQRRVGGDDSFRLVSHAVVVLLPEDADDRIDLAVLHQLLTIHSANLPN